ncbi:hypothetical protein PTKU46_94700 [Paraburkholderia terrae]
MARNRVQHQEHLGSNRPCHSPADLKRLQNPFFMDEHEQSILAGKMKGTSIWTMAPRVSVTGDQLTKALDAVSAFSDWMDTAMDKLNQHRGGGMHVKQATRGITRSNVPLNEGESTGADA